MRQISLMALAVVIPLCIGLLFGHPTGRIVVPMTLAFSVAVILTVLGGVVPGLTAAIVSTFVIYYFNFSPSYSFDLTNPGDSIAIAISALFACTLVVVVATLIKRQGRAEREAAIQRQSVLTLQRALLPERVPPVADLSVGWHYQAGGDDFAPVGGDWLAFVPIAETRIGLAVGDVAGHGLDAVRAMAQYRFALATVATQGENPGMVLEEVDRIANFYGIDLYCTCTYGIVDTVESTWTFASAGHPCGLLLRDGLDQKVDVHHGPPLGMLPHDKEYLDASVQLKVGDLLALYSDGLVEERGEHLDQGIRRLAKVLTEIGSGLDTTELSRKIVARLVGPQSRDDVALIVARVGGYSM
jgi:serine phosphatase RsbU (regulator of sigma subunit)